MLTVHLYKLLDLFGNTMSESFFRQRPTLLQRVDRFDLVTAQYQPLPPTGVISLLYLDVTRLVSRELSNEVR